MVFLDTNVLLYASLEQDSRKRSIACVILEDSFRNASGMISLQVLREFANVLFKKARLPTEEVKRIVHGFMALPCVGDSTEGFDLALDIKARFDIQFNDALIIATAKLAGCDTIYSEDMGDGDRYEGVRVVNPFTRGTKAKR